MLKSNKSDRSKIDIIYICNQESNVFSRGNSCIWAHDARLSTFFFSAITYTAHYLVSIHYLRKLYIYIIYTYIYIYIYIYITMMITLFHDCTQKHTYTHIFICVFACVYVCKHMVYL